MSQIFTIVDDAVVINKLALTYTSGSVNHTGSLTVKGDIAVDSLKADTINVKNLVTENGALDSLGEWKYDTEIELNGKGFTWAWDNNETKLIFRTGNRLWSNATLDLAQGSSYSIDDTVVLTADSLGDSVVNSSLTSLGTLESLSVSGDVTLSDFVFVNSIYNRIGIGTDEPNASLSILDNNVEITLGSPDNNIATIGTYTSHDLGLISDNTIRVLLKSDGEVVIGNEGSKTGVLRVHGTIYAETIETDNRLTRTHPLEFRPTADTSIYGLGLMWLGTNGETTKQLIMQPNPNRIWSSENFELGQDKAYYVNGSVVLTKTELGSSVTTSSLKTLGNLESLTVDGDAVFNGNVTLNSINAQAIEFGDVTISHSGFSTSGSISVTANSAKVLYADDNQVSIGDSQRNDKPVKVFGPLSVNITNPDPSVNFSVNGDVSLGGKKFTKGSGAPITGSFNIGDICWNTHPQANSYVGWICVVSGDPGEWLPFGAINLQ